MYGKKCHVSKLETKQNKRCVSVCVCVCICICIICISVLVFELPFPDPSNDLVSFKNSVLTLSVTGCHGFQAWMENRGMGFIAPSDGSQDLFVHRSYLADGGQLRDSRANTAALCSFA